MEEEGIERICCNCNQFLPVSLEETTEFGVCLRDEAFEPYIEDLLENPSYSSCQDLVDCRKFPGERKSCENFEEVEWIEIDDNSLLGKELESLCKSGEFTLEPFERVLLEEMVRNIDWKTMPVDQYVEKLRSPKTEEQKSGIASLGGMISLGNKEAFGELFGYFKQLPPPETIEDVHFKKEVLRQLEHNDTRQQIIPRLIEELYSTPSNNTTRQWISDIFRFLECVPRSEIREPLERMLEDKRFSYRLKKRIEDMLYQ